MRAIYLAAVSIFLISSVTVASDLRCKNDYTSVLNTDITSDTTRGSANSQSSEFECYAEIAMTKEFTALIYAYKKITGQSDNLYEPKLALISTVSDGPKVTQIIDLRNKVPVYVERPGNFYRMDAVGEAFKLSDTESILHINVWAVISGSGAISGGSDLFYFFGGNKLSPALEILGDYSFNKQNINFSSQKISDIHFGLTKSTWRLYVQTKNVQVEKGTVKATAPQLSVYDLREGKFYSVESLGPIPTGIVNLKRVGEESWYEGMNYEN